MSSTERRWCVVLHAAGRRSAAESAADIAVSMDRAELIAARHRTIVAAMRGVARDPRWPRDVRHTGDVRRFASGPLLLHAAMRIARECPDAIVATLGPHHQPGDAIRYVAAVRQGAQWVADHPTHVYALVRPTAQLEEWDPSLALRPRPARIDEVPMGAWSDLSLVFRVDVLLRLMEVHEPSWWAVAHAKIASDAWAMAPAWPCRLEQFDVMRDVLLRSASHLRIRPVLPAMLVRGPSTIDETEAAWPLVGDGRGR